ncbi:MAG TPA: GTPase ObgE [Bacilli bacterium]|nr:GTPase ObgE [Bacilli bacterium]
MFVDEVIVKVIAGAGGDGCTAFRREKYVPLGGPFGGNGGRGSSIVFAVDENLRTLVDFRYNKIIKGDKGQNGMGKNCHGKGAEDIIIKVPPGTFVIDQDTNLVICDLKKNKEQFVIAKGGRGGRGNTAFKTDNNTAPNFSEKGEPGEEKLIKIELKLLADVGLVGMPSVGKSTILSKISRSKPKIAAYHFTTLNPNLGVVKDKKNRSFVVADLPGLIEGASLGGGLGIKFLKHIERTRVIVHVIDMAKTEGRDPYDDYLKIRKELENFNSKILDKQEVIVANKMDILGAEDNLKEFKSHFDKNIKIFEISAISSQGLDDVLLYVGELLDNIKEESIIEDAEYEDYILYKFKHEEPFTIEKDNNVFVIKGDEIEKLFRMTKFNSDEGILRFAKKLSRMGVDEKLEQMGAKSGDRVRILDFEFDYRA